MYFCTAVAEEGAGTGQIEDGAIGDWERTGRGMVPRWYHVVLRRFGAGVDVQR